MSGEETRDNLTQRAGDIADQARDTFEQGRERIRSSVSAIRGGMQGGEQRTGTESGV
jgi:hypothetical protein